MCDDEDLWRRLTRVWLPLSFVMNKDVFYWGFISCVFILRTCWDNSYRRIYYWCVLFMLFSAQIFFLYLCDCVLPADFPRELQAKQRWEEMQILRLLWVSAAAAVYQGQMWLPALWALTFISCDVIKQKGFDSWATVRWQSPIIRKTFGFLSQNKKIKLNLYKGDFLTLFSSFPFLSLLCLQRV